MLAVPRSAVVVACLLLAVASLATARSGEGRILDGPVTILASPGPGLSVRSDLIHDQPTVGFQVDLEPPFPSLEPTSHDVTGGVIRAVSEPGDYKPARALGLDVEACAFNLDEPGTATGLHAYALGSDCSPAVGVDAEAYSDVSVGGVYCGIGVRGRTVYGSSYAYGVYSDGDFAATGSKSFLQPDPSQPGRAIRFSALEGNESGTYFRGTAELVGGRAELPIPESWRLASEADGITVQLTAVGASLGLYVVEQSRERIVVGGERDGTFHFLVNGLRRGYADHEDLVENRFFRPSVRGVPFGTQYPPALREVLVENGILNPDGTPNEATARAQGWELLDPDDVPVARRWWLSVAERRELLRREGRRPERRQDERRGPSR